MTQSLFLNLFLVLFLFYIIVYASVSIGNVRDIFLNQSCASACERRGGVVPGFEPFFEYADLTCHCPNGAVLNMDVGAMWVE